MKATTLLAVAGLGLLAACGPLVQIGGNAKAPVALLTIRASAVPSERGRTVDVSRTFSVVTPTVPGPLQTLRLPVITRDTEIAYLTGATWAEQPNKQFARVLADTLQSRGLAVLGPRSSGAGATRLLSGQLVEFGLDVRDAAAPKVMLRYDALLTGDGGKTLGLRRFDQSIPVTSQAPGDVAMALNTAANNVAAEVADWVVR